jgi:hypothetical protein
VKAKNHVLRTLEAKRAGAAGSDGWEVADPADVGHLQELPFDRCRDIDSTIRKLADRGSARLDEHGRVGEVRRLELWARGEPDGVHVHAGPQPVPSDDRLRRMRAAADDVGGFDGLSISRDGPGADVRCERVHLFGCSSGGDPAVLEQGGRCCLDLLP